MSKEEGNKLIADGCDLIDLFMGNKSPIGIEDAFIYENLYGDELDMMIGWDALMNVIDDIKYNRRNKFSMPSEISHPGYRLYKNIEKALLNLSKEQTFNAVVQFIQWYTTQTPKV